MLLTGLVFTILLATRRNLVIFLIEHDIYEVHSFLKLRIPSYVLSMTDVLALSVFAALAGAVILRTFRKTVSAEIFFFAFWLATVSFESFRLVHLFIALGGGSDSFLALIDKLYIGTRFLGYFAIFISGLYASGMRNDRQFSILFIGVGISIVLVSILPVNTGIWARTLMFKVGYSMLIEGFSLAIILITVANYLIAVRVRGDKAYYYIALGIAAIAAGAQYLSRDGSPLLSLVSILTMATGSFLYIYKIHSFYLWQ